MRRHALITAVLFTCAVPLLAACDKSAPAPAPEAVAPSPAAPADPAATDEAPAAPDEGADEAPVPPDEPDPAPTEPAAPAPPPAEFTFTPSPSLADIPDKPLHGKVKGVAFDEAAVKVEYSSSDWSLEVAFADKQFFKVILTEDATEPAAGYTLRKEKACCWGYLHHVPEGASRATSLNAPNGFVVEVTAWEVAPYDESGSMKQPAGTLKGRLAVAYDEESWVAGTFEVDFEYFGPPPHVAQAIKARQLAEAEAAVGPWASLAAPEGVTLAKGEKVWAAARQRDRWTWGEFKVEEVAGAVVRLSDDAVTAPGLVRAMPVATDLKVGSMAVAIDHLGAQHAKIVALGADKHDVRYLNPAMKPRDNQIKADRFTVRATRPEEPGQPPSVFFDGGPTGRAAGLAIARAADGGVVVLVTSGGTSSVETVAEADVTWVDSAKVLKKGQRVEAVVGCGMNSRVPREGKVVEVIEGGLGYVVDADPCKGTTLSRERIRAL